MQLIMADYCSVQGDPIFTLSQGAAARCWGKRKHEIAMRKVAIYAKLPLGKSVLSGLRCTNFVVPRDKNTHFNESICMEILLTHSPIPTHSNLYTHPIYWTQNLLITFEAGLIPLAPIIASFKLRNSNYRCYCDLIFKFQT